ncbi:MAG: DUF1232 domain-containing protein [Fibrella sp.]|nr:DUF1232 domain-containing protein [Armatimonadota bacterium]
MFFRIKSFTRAFKRELKVYQLVLKDEETPRVSRVFLGLAVGYVLMPFDLIPDFIPVLGQLDDIVIVPLFLWLAFRFLPKAVLERCREQVEREQQEQDGVVANPSPVVSSPKINVSILSTGVNSSKTDLDTGGTDNGESLPDVSISVSDFGSVSPDLNPRVTDVNTTVSAAPPALPNDAGNRTNSGEKSHYIFHRME